METIEKIKNVLFNGQSELKELNKTLVALEKANLKSFWEKTLEKFKKDYNINCYYHKDDVDVFNKFCVYYKTKDNHGESHGWVEIHCFNSLELIEELKKLIDQRKNSIEKTKKTIKQIKKIEKWFNKIIELKKEFSYQNYNSDILHILADSITDSYYLNNRY